MLWLSSPGLPSRAETGLKTSSSRTTSSSLPLARQFFPLPDPSLDKIDPAILSSPPGTDITLSPAACAYLGHLQLTTNDTQEFYTETFTIRTLELLGFEEPSVIIPGCSTIPLTICGVIRVARADICLAKGTFVLLVIIRDEEFVNAEARVFAEAIAAFQSNNKRREEYGLSPLNAMTIPCITFSGTRPTFYLVPVTTELNEAVITGTYPEHTTWVSQCATAAAHIDVSIGMRCTEYRKLALKHFLAFKALAKSHWVHISEGM